MKYLFGGILLSLGILIGGLSGLCTLYAMFTLGLEALIFGGIPIVIGVLLFLWGRSLLRRAKAEESAAAGDDSQVF